VVSIHQSRAESDRWPAKSFAARNGPAESDRLTAAKQATGAWAAGDRQATVRAVYSAQFLAA